ncbi:hypothetical protein L6R46_31265, partial [Myxococcota bacterium]|nr:hypothetical protein [Myxococcota bacterium]
LGWRLLSVSPSVTMRRVTMLAEGVELDSPVKSTQEIPLKEVWTPGFALVVHAPLDLMGAARSKGE